VAQLKTFLLIAAFFIVRSLARPFKSGYDEIEDCVVHAVDPAEGNCWWGYETQSCLEIYANSTTQCADYCFSCLSCIYEYGCIIQGNPVLFKNCYYSCIANVPLDWENTLFVHLILCIHISIYLSSYKCFKIEYHHYVSWLNKILFPTFYMYEVCILKVWS